MYSIVTDFNKINPLKWRNFIDNNTFGNIFQTPEFYNVYNASGKTEPLIVCCENEETKEVVGIMLCTIYREHKGFPGNFSARSVIWGGPVVKNNDEAVMRLLLSSYISKIKGKVIYTEIRNFNDQSGIKEIFKSYKFSYIPHLNIRLDLSIGEEKLWENLKKQRKEGIRKAQRNNFIFKEEDENFELSVFYNLLKSSYRRISLPFPAYSFFVGLNKCFSRSDVRYFTLSKDNVVIIALCALVYNHCIYAFYIGITGDELILNKRPVDLFYWELILFSSEHDIYLFDWLGAGNPEKDSGVRKFKLEYGGELLELGRFLKIHKPVIMKFSSFVLSATRKLKSFFR
jgi:lipid II:glycine glycyltransferase (peptidoglycan interpeptide bridge formation enzyme)